MSAQTLFAKVESPTPGVSLVRLSGTISQDFPHEQIRHLAGAVVFDLEGITRITSFGVREWLAALSKLQASFVGFVRCAPAVVAQLNMVSGFAGGGEVLTLYLPYACDGCDAEQRVLVTASQAAAELRRGGPDPIPCAACGQDAELDEPPTSYLAYVASRPDPRPPRPVRRLLGMLESDASRPFSLRKEVEGAVTALWLGGYVDKRLRIKRVLDGLEGHVVVICAGVSGMDDVGADRLRELAKRTDAFFARVSLDLLASFPEAGREALRGRVLTTLLTPPHRRTLEFDARILAQEIARVDAGGRAAEWLPPTVLRALKELLVTAAPLDLIEYLRDRPGAAPASPEPGEAPAADEGDRKVGDRYRVVRRIGRGGMAEVLLAEVLGPGGFKKRVVIKRVLSELTRDPEFTEMFLREARLAARISHPNVVQVHDLGREGGDYFMAMEYVRGWDLRNILRYTRRSKRLLPTELCCRIVSDVAAGLHAAHTAVGDDGQPLGIVHRDVSPDNVLISVQGAVKVADFGISKQAGAQMATKPGTVRGKVIYIAPELLDGTLGVVDHRVDVFALGLMLHECLTGTPALWRQDETASMRAALEADVPPVETLRPEVSPMLADVVARATARLPSDRYESARHIHLALERVILDLGQPASSAHLAHWLHGLMRQRVAEGEVQGLEVTPELDDSMEEDDAGVTVTDLKVHLESALGSPEEDGS